MRPTTNFAIHALAAALLAAFAATAVAAAPAFLKLGTIKGDPTASTPNGDGPIEVKSYSFGNAPAGRANKVEGFTVKQGMKPADPKQYGEWIADVEQPQGSGKGSVWVRVASPWAACRVGVRYPSIELSDGTKRYVLQDVTVANCGGLSAPAGQPAEAVAFYYNRIAFNYGH